MLSRIRWGILRLLFVFFAASAVMTGGVAAFFLGPLYSWYFFGDLNCAKYYKYIYPIFFAYLRFVMRGIKDSEYRKGFSVPFSDPPCMSPSAEALHLQGSWTGPVENCDNCVDCCRQVRCPLMDTVNNNCLSYGCFFWRFFSCGRYPINQFQAAYYQCPKWEFSEG